MAIRLFPHGFLSFVSVGVAVGMYTRSPLSGAFAGLVAMGTTLAALWSVKRQDEDIWRELARATARGAKDLTGPTVLISEIKEMTASLQDMQSRKDVLDAVFDGMADGLWITDEEGTILRSNASLNAIFEWKEPLEGQRPLVILRRLDLQEAILAACQFGKSTELDLDIQARTFHVRVAPLGLGRQGSFAIFHDVTALRRLETMRRDFVANVSHELGTPITAITGYAETLKNGAWTHPQHAPRMIEIIERQAQRLSSLVQDLLELSRLESGLFPVQKVEIVPASTIQRVVETLAHKAQQKQIVVSIDVSRAIHAKADPRGVEHVLMNLIDNAIKYTPEGGRVSVRAFGHEGLSIFEVRDNGIGIEAIHLSRLFERFYRVDSGRSRDLGGTGLGLAIVKHWVTAMQGDVRVESQPNQGTLFSISLPSFSKKNENVE